ncbi:MAG: VanZ family protein [Oscillospiraceae bacterium]|jgi:VanZ family protein|nr:VanZ family protein [Oscillospiraceae bacterium]
MIIKINRKKLGYAIVAATVLFIFSNSCLPRDQSLEVSDGAKEILERVFGADSVFSLFLQEYIRKIGHVLEYGLLGVEVALVSGIHREFGLWRFYHCMAFGLMAAVLDESIQILSGRGPLVSDILLDTAAFSVLGALTALLVLATGKKKGV